MKKIMIIIFLGAAICVNGGNKKRKKSSWVKLTDLSKKKNFKHKTVWQRAICKHCNGTGHKVKSRYDARKNRMIKWFIPCYYCKGRGTRGMTKK